MNSLTIAMLAAAAANVHPAEVEEQLAFMVGDWSIKGLEAN